MSLIYIGVSEVCRLYFRLSGLGSGGGDHTVKSEPRGRYSRVIVPEDAQNRPIPFKIAGWLAVVTGEFVDETLRLMLAAGYSLWRGLCQESLLPKPPVYV